MPKKTKLHSNSLANIDEQLDELLRPFEQNPRVDIVEENGRLYERAVFEPGYTSVFDKHTTTDLKELPPEVKDFRCPICNSTEFTAVHTMQKPFGSNSYQPFKFGPPSGPKTTRLVISEYRCLGCTTVFHDPARYSANRPRE